MDNYKGFFYDEKKEQKYYEGGAHFRYKDLFEMLLFIGGELPEKENDNNNKLIVNNDLKDISDNLSINQNKLKPKTRNFNQFNFVNNPNTQITFNKDFFKKNNNNAFSIKNALCMKSRNNQNNYFLEDTNKNYNKTNINIFNYNKNNLRNTLFQTFFNKKTNNQNNKNNINNEEKNDNNIFHNKFNSLQYIYKHNKKNKKKIFLKKKNIHQFNYNNNQNCNIKYSDIINSYNNNVNNLLNIRKNNNSISNEKHLNFFKDKLNIYFPKNDIDKNYSKSIINKNIYGNNLGYNKDMNHKDKNININNLIEQSNNEIVPNMKNCYSGLIMNNYMNKTLNKKIYIDGNNLSLKNNIINKEKNIKIPSNSLVSQKYIRKKISQLFSFNHNFNLNQNIRNNLSRNINNNMNNIYNSQTTKFKTSEIKNINNFNI